MAFLHEHAIQRAHTGETLRTYAEILYDWFDALEQSGILWNEVDASDLIAYRNRMLKHPSPHTGRSYSVRTINHRVRGVLRFYGWAVRHHWLTSSPLIERAEEFATLQNAFLGHLEAARTKIVPSSPADSSQIRAAVPPGTAVSLFGFDCKDPLAGIAPGTRAGEICHHFLGCFTCPNAVITGDPTSLARLLETRDHLRASATYLHPARFEAIYAPLLKILEEDILTRFSAAEFAAAATLCRKLPPIPELR